MRVKEICDFVSRGATPDYVDESQYKVMNQATFSKGFIDTGCIRYTRTANNIANIRKGDLLMASTGGGVLGKLLYFDSEDKQFYADTHVTILRNTQGKHLMKYLFYFFSTRYEEINMTLVKGSTNQTELQRNYLLAYEINIPNLEMQKKIVAYLDTKTAEIDRKIGLLERESDAYSRLKAAVINRAVTRGLTPNAPLKDSGIEWIGMIPKHWKVDRLKDLGYMYSGLTGKSGDDFRCEDDTITKPFIPFTNILYNTAVSNGQLNRVVISDKDEQNTVKKGDLLFLMSSEDYDSIGKCAVVNHEMGEVYLNSFCRGYRIMVQNLDASFLNYLLSANLYRDALRLEARGFTRINLKVNKIADLNIAYPPLPEQEAIATYLDAECAKIDAKMANIAKRIDVYKCLKRALIDEVVTGKRTVNE